MITLTSHNIDLCKTNAGGFTSAQVKFLGLDLKTKWKKQAIGMEITKYTTPICQDNFL